MSRYSSGVRSLIAQLLKKDPHARPSTGAVLRRPLIKDKIGRFLSETQVRPEYTPIACPCNDHWPHQVVLRYAAGRTYARPRLTRGTRFLVARHHRRILHRRGVTAVSFVFAQIKEEFSNGVSPGHQPSSSSPAAAAGAAPSPPPGAGGAAPRWPFNGAGISRPRPEAASPGQAGRGRDGNNAGRAIAAGGGGGRVPQAAKVGDGRRRGRAAEEAAERRRAEAMARKRELRGEGFVGGVCCEGMCVFCFRCGTAGKRVPMVVRISV